MKQTVGAYRAVTASNEFKELERMRSRTRNNEASALGHARREGEKAEREKWLGLVAEKDTEIANKDAEIADKDTVIADKDTVIADKDTVIADKDTVIADKVAENEKLRIQLAELMARLGEGR